MGFVRGMGIVFGHSGFGISGFCDLRSLGFIRGMGFIGIDFGCRVKRGMGFGFRRRKLGGVGKFYSARPDCWPSTLTGGSQREAMRKKPALRLIARERYRLPVSCTGLFPLTDVVKETSLGSRQEVVVLQTA